MNRFFTSSASFVSNLFLIADCNLDCSDGSSQGSASGSGGPEPDFELRAGLRDGFQKSRAPGSARYFAREKYLVEKLDSRKSGWDRAQPGPTGRDRDGKCQPDRDGNRRAAPGRDGFSRAGPGGPNADPFIHLRSHYFGLFRKRLSYTLFQNSNSKFL